MSACVRVGAHACGACAPRRSMWSMSAHRKVMASTISVEHLKSDHLVFLCGMMTTVMAQKKSETKTPMKSCATSSATK